MPLLSFLTAIAKAFLDLPGLIVNWLHDTLVQGFNPFAAVSVPMLIVVAVIGALVALAAVRTATR